MHIRDQQPIADTGKGDNAHLPLSSGTSCIPFVVGQQVRWTPSNTPIID